METGNIVDRINAESEAFRLAFKLVQELDKRLSLDGYLRDIHGQTLFHLDDVVRPILDDRWPV